MNNKLLYVLFSALLIISQPALADLLDDSFIKINDTLPSIDSGTMSSRIDAYNSISGDLLSLSGTKYQLSGAGIINSTLLRRLISDAFDYYAISTPYQTLKNDIISKTSQYINNYQINYENVDGYSGLLNTYYILIPGIIGYSLASIDAYNDYEIKFNNLSADDALAYKAEVYLKLYYITLSLNNDGVATNLTPTTIILKYQALNWTNPGITLSEKIQSLPQGWSLIGVEPELTDFTIFSNTLVVWYYDNMQLKWFWYSENTNVIQELSLVNNDKLTVIPAHSGIWVFK